MKIKKRSSEIYKKKERRRFIDTIRVINTSLNNLSNNLSENIYNKNNICNKKGKHCLKCKDLWKCREYQDDSTECCKKCKDHKNSDYCKKIWQNIKCLWM